jgi:Amidohydrolase family/IPT/TIG domain
LVFLDRYHWADARTPEEKAEFQKGYKKVQEFLRKFVAAGGRLYSGTDSASATVPGLSLHHEMQLLVDAGIPPIRAIQSSTLWAAQMARMDKTIGSVETGKVGDIVILAADPLADIHNTQSVERVIKGGVVQDTGYHASYDVPIHTWGPVGKHLYSLPPAVANLIPGSAGQGSDVWIKVTGANFSPNSVVLFDGTPVETKWVSDKEMSARLSPKQTSQWGTYLIGVSTPKPGGGETEGLAFVVEYK